MANVLGELFGEIAEAIREKTGDTATMKPAEFPSKISSITTGGSNDVVLLARQDIGGFALSTDFGVFAKDYAGTSPFVLEVGQKYRVLWDGEEVSCTAYSNSALGYPIVCIGDGTQIGGQSKNEPFLIAYTPNANWLTLFAKDDKTTHNVAVYQVVESGGSSADVRYVTFMSYDGSVEYGKKAVAVGDDCADPIARGVFSTPTRESVVQYDYAFAGWATTANGALDANALKAVEEDRTVYANFAAVARIYAVRFFDGNTQMGTTQYVAYGSKATPPDTTRDGCTFDGWTPADLTVYGDTDFVGSWSLITGLFYLKSVPKLSGYVLNDFSINRQGTRLSMAVGGNAAINRSVIYDLTQDAPTQLDTPISTSMGNRYFNKTNYNYDDSLVISHSTASNSGSANVFDSEDGSWLHNVTATTASMLFCSPTENIFAIATGGYGTYAIKLMREEGTKATAIVTTASGYYSASIGQGRFSCDGAYMAVPSSTSDKYTQIFKRSDGSHVKRIDSANYVRKVSWSGDGSKLAISTSGAPYVEIYDTNTWNKICDLSDFFTGSSSTYAEFVHGTGTLVVGSGTTVKAFDMTGNTPQLLENAPVYAGESVSDIRSNFSGTHVGIMYSSGIEIWGMN